MIEAATTIFEIILNFVQSLLGYGLRSLESILEIENAQPVAFTILIGGMLMVFLFTPFVFGFNWNDVIFGSVEWREGAISTAPWWEELTDAEMLAAVDDLHLVKVTPGRYADVFRKLNEPLNVHFGIGEKAIIPADMTVNSLVEAPEQFQNVMNETCGQYANLTANASVWEADIRFSNADWLKQIVASGDSPNLRTQPIKIKCLEIDVDASSEISIPGAASVDKLDNFDLFMNNGSICPDYSLSTIQREVADPTKPGGMFYWVTDNVVFRNTIGAAYRAANFLLGRDYSDLTVMNRTDCYLMVDKRNRQRIFKQQPAWIKDTDEASANLTTLIIYGGSVVVPPRPSAESLEAIGSIGFRYPKKVKYGFASVVLVPYDFTKTTVSHLTFGMSDQYAEASEIVMIAIIMIIIGLVGIIMILHAKKT